MCGHSSFLFTGKSLWAKNDSQNKFLEAAHKISHRGHEKMRTKFFPNLYLAHFRLAFQDVLENTQPLLSSDGAWAIVFNGEIYNYRELRKKLECESSYDFSTQGDTEVILAGFLTYGVKIQEMLEGEYSFSIFRTDGSECFAFRDPCGVKPFFIAAEGVSTDLFACAQEHYKFKTPILQFSSEIKGLAAEKKWNRPGVLRQAVGLYEPIRTPFENIIALPANSYLHAKRQGSYFNVRLHLKAESVRSSARGSGIHSSIYSDFANCLHDSVKERTVSDVELGVYLSGGIDSKVVAYELAQLTKLQKKSHKLKSFTIGFQDAQYDESQNATAFAKQLNFDPHLIKVTNKDLQYAYPLAVYFSENVQPYTNGAAKWWLSLFTSQHVRGVLTGDGADELLGGYPSFRYANWWKFAMRARDGKNIFDKLKRNALGSVWRDSVYQKKFMNHAQNPWLSGSSHAGTGEDFLQSLSLWGVAHPLFGEIKAIACALLGAEEGMEFLSQQKESVASWFAFGLEPSEEFLTDSENALLLWQNYFFKTHLPVQVLNWVGDRMEMANTLEGRTPFLSSKMRNFVYALPDFMLVRGFEEKSILRMSYKNAIQQEAFTPKKQFNAPFLYPQNDPEWIEQIEQAVCRTGLLDKKYVSALLAQSVEPDGANFSYAQTYRQSALQTLASFAILDKSLVGCQVPTRDLDYEQQVLYS